MKRKTANQQIPMPVGLLIGLAIFLAILVAQASATPLGAGQDPVRGNDIFAETRPTDGYPNTDPDEPSSAVCNHSCALVFGNTRQVSPAV